METIMPAEYSGYARAKTEPAFGAFTITPDDNTNLPRLTRGIYVGGSGDLTVEMERGEQVTFTSVPAGALLPLQLRKVTTATTATSLIGLY